MRQRELNEMVARTTGESLVAVDHLMLTDTAIMKVALRARNTIPE